MARSVVVSGRTRAAVLLVLSVGLIAARPVSSAGLVVEHDPVDCIVAGHYPLLPACFQPADQVARGRVYFQAEGETSWYFVEMKPSPPCWAGVLPKPSRTLINRHVRYYVETIARNLGSARTPEYAPLVVGSAAECKLPKVAALSPSGPASVQPFLPGGFTVGSITKPLVIVGGGVATVGGIILVTHPGGPSPSPTPGPTPGPTPTPTPSPTPTPGPGPTPTPAATPSPSPSATPTPTPSATPTPSPTPTPTPTPTPSPSPTPTPGPGALSATCTASPQSGVAPLSVRFTVTAQGGTGSYAYAWVFGDGGTSTAANPTHVYVTAADYVPAVQVTSGAERVSCSNPVTVTAAAPPTFALTVSRQGGGSGAVTSAPAGINCGSTCAASYAQGTTVSLTAQADPGSVFAGWSGACSGTGGCSVTMNAAKSVSARFDLRNFTLSLTKTPLGLILGSVTSAPAGINCALLCANASASYPSGTVVTLTAQALLTALFQGWAGPCSGTGTCVITMDGDKSVTANFATLGLLTTHADAGGGEVDIGLMRSSFRVPRGRGEVTLDGRTILVTAEGEGQAGLRVQPGNNLVEAWIREASGPGLWRFELDPAAIEPGSLRVVAGDPMAVGPSSVTFRLSGRAGDRVSFAIRISRGRADPSAP